jgi:hypothetical protein
MLLFVFIVMVLKQKIMIVDIDFENEKRARNLCDIDNGLADAWFDFQIDVDKYPDWEHSNETRRDFFRQKVFDNHNN